MRGFPQGRRDTPIVLMGYFNPIYAYGVERFLADAKAAGVDGLIVVDLPPEEDEELCLPAMAAGLDFIRLATPTTDDARLPAVLANTSGFLYYVSIAGVTGTQAGLLPRSHSRGGAPRRPHDAARRGGLRHQNAGRRPREIAAHRRRGGGRLGARRRARGQRSMREGSGGARGGRSGLQLVAELGARRRSGARADQETVRA